jgi:nitroimidazol reductase NimA-like FMN-containing flavoprotein (pyridoxamine 5'-phosphate oxidase superfamily)
MASRKFQESLDEIEKILCEETVGYLGLSKDGIPYVVPLNYAYAAGKIVFHCALSGRKLDYLQANPLVCFTVGRMAGQAHRHAEGSPCDIDNDSVICYGMARIVEALEERQKALDLFNRRFNADADLISLESAAKCYAVEITITHMTGRQQRGEERAYWRYSFEA